MNLPPTGRGGIIHPAAGDPQQPTLHTCSDCGFQLLIVAGMVPTVADMHRRGCLGPKLADLAERLTELRRAVDAMHIDLAGGP